MTDHDRDAGSRGGDPPRDPSRPEPAPYGHPYGGHFHGGAAGPGWGPLPPPPPPPPKPAVHEFFRRKQTQIVGAALAGLVVGGILGGSAVALTGTLIDRPGPSARLFQEGPGLPDREGPYCYESRGRVICDVNPAPLRTG